MQFTESTIGALLLVAIGLAVVAVLVSVVALSGQKRVREAYRVFSMGSRDDVLTMLQRHIEEVNNLRRDVGSVRGYADEIRGLLRSSVSRVGTVRYDAFDDMGGRLSFSTALLDEYGDGVVITSINGRTETRTYAKAISQGRSRHNLSDEELAAIERAMALMGRVGGSGDMDQPIRRATKRSSKDGQR